MRLLWVISRVVQYGVFFLLFLVAWGFYQKGTQACPPLHDLFLWVVLAFFFFVCLCLVILILLFVSWLGTIRSSFDFLQFNIFKRNFETCYHIWREVKRVFLEKYIFTKRLLTLIFIFIPNTICTQKQWLVHKQWWRLVV